MRVRLIFLAATVFLAGILPCAARPVLTLRSDLWCPYNCAPDSDHPGYAVEIVQAVFGAAGYDVDYQLLNWTRSIDDVRRGLADAVIGAYATDVPGFIIPKEPIGRSSTGFAARKRSGFRYTDPQSLDGQVLGVVATYEFPGLLGDYMHKMQNDKSRIQYMSGDGALAKNLLKLIAGHVDVVLDDANVLQRQVNELQLGDHITFSQDNTRVPVYIAFSPAGRLSGRYAAILSAGIAELRASGRLSRILARYGVEDWQMRAGH